MKKSAKKTPARSASTSIVEKLSEFCVLTPQPVTLKVTLGYALAAYLFALGCRLLWLFHYSGAEYVTLDGAYLLITHDGYAWAAGAQERIAGAGGPLSPSATRPPSILLAALFQILPVSLADLLVYSPAVLGALIVFPMILLGVSLGSIWVGVLAGTFVSLSEIYFTRTALGYVDTDMLNMTLALMAIWAFVESVRTLDRRLMLAGGLLTTLAVWWYPSIWVLFAAGAPLLALDTLLKDRRDLRRWFVVATMFVAAAPLPFFIAAAPGLIFFFLWPHHQRLSNLKGFYPIVGVAGVLGILGLGIANRAVLDKLGFYILRSDRASEEGEFRFLAVQESIGELGVFTPVDTIALMSSSIAVFAISLLGFMLLLRSQRTFLILLPFLVLGLSAFFLGARFSLFAAPALALGCAFLIAALLQNARRPWGPLAAGGLALAALAPAIYNAWSFDARPIVFSPTAEVAREVDQMSAEGDYVAAWWDYGYLLEYLTDLETVVDGGSMVNAPLVYAVSHALICGDQQSAHAMISAAVEGVDRFGSRWPGTDVLGAAAQGTALPTTALNRDAYFFLNDEMLDKLALIRRHCAVDLNTGEEASGPTLAYQEQYGQDVEAIWKLYQARQPETLRRSTSISDVIFVNSNASGEVTSRTRWRVNVSGTQTLIVRRQRGDALMLDDSLLQTPVIQLLLLGDPDPRYFELVSASQTAKAYRLKREVATTSDD